MKTGFKKNCFKIKHKLFCFFDDSSYKINFDKNYEYKLNESTMQYAMCIGSMMYTSMGFEVCSEMYEFLNPWTVELRYYQWYRKKLDPKKELNFLGESY